MARILHVSDWHLGLTTRGVERLADHEQALGEICEIAAVVRPHLILHTGDLFHTPHPANEAVRLAFDVLHRLEALCPVIVLRGNHDGIEHFRALQSVLGEATRIRLVDVPKRPGEGGVVEVEGEPGEIVRVGLLPFLESNRARIIERLTKDWTTWATQYADGVAGVEGVIAAGLLEHYDASKHILLFAAHLHLDVAVPSQSERRRHIVEEYAARAASIPRDVSYAAFGHIHNPQRLRAAMPAWYAGSPIPVDFGEITDAKRVIAVEVHPGTPADVAEHFLRRTGRRLLRIDATLEEIEAMAADVNDAICDIVVRTPTTVPDLSDRVAALLPQASFASIQGAAADARIAPLAGGTPSDEQVAEGYDALFRRFVEAHPPASGSAQLADDVFCALLGDGEGMHRFEDELALDRVDDLVASLKSSAEPAVAPDDLAATQSLVRRESDAPSRPRRRAKATS
jgi:DNA repair protein SbcD/Mre11